jgi:hypothetical protein
LVFLWGSNRNETKKITLHVSGDFFERALMMMAKYQNANHLNVFGHLTDYFDCDEGRSKNKIQDILISCRIRTARSEKTGQWRSISKISLEITVISLFLNCIQSR